MILDELAAHARARVDAAERRIPLGELRERALAMSPARHAFAAAIARPGLSLVCEVKKASPSRGVIDPEFDYLAIARDYERAGADCLSCLTEPRWFMGSDDVFRAIRDEVGCPMVRKDFTVSDYQVYEARLMGADAVLLVCAILGREDLGHCLRVAESLGLDALVEAHDEAELSMAAEAGATVIGVNNRDLRDFTVDAGRAARLRSSAPAGALFVAESGVRGPDDVAGLSERGVDAVLVGEALMRSGDRVSAVRELREAATR